MRRIALLVGIAFCLALSLRAEAGSPEDPLGRYLFPPERVIGHSQEIGLDEAQRSRIRDEVQKAQPKFLDFQFALQDAMSRVSRLLQEKPVDEAKVLAEIDKVLSLEREVKRLQISLLIRIKNVLTPAQQAKLTELSRSDSR